MNIFLVGPMGAGKTTIGKLLAKKLNKPFLDADQELERQTGVNIPWIFDVEGEAGFRYREAAIIDTLTQEKDIVLATGGGAVLKKQNRQALKNRGKVIYLSVDVKTQIGRTEKGHQRPLLQIDNVKKKLEELYNIRHPIYMEIADYHVATNKYTI
ncbi:MAG: shikimate kinase AroK, partial [Pseudomonadota bacterium]